MPYSIDLRQRLPFVRCYMLRCVAFDFILRVILCSMMSVTLVIKIFCVHLNDLATNVPSFRVPCHMITNFKLLWHKFYFCILNL